MDLSPEKILVVAMIALMVLGPERLPQAARTAGKMLAEVRRLSATVQNQVTNAIAEPRDAVSQSADELGLTDIRKTLSGAGLSLRGALNEVVNGATGQVTGPAIESRPAVESGPAVDAQAEPTTATPGSGIPVLLLPAAAGPDDLSLN
jgi:sec-independent protein translocase protein TatB